MRVLLLIATVLAVESFTVPSAARIIQRRASLFTVRSTPTPEGNNDRNGKDDTSELMSMIEKRDIFIQNLEKQLDDLEVQLSEKKTLLRQREVQLSEREAEATEKSGMLTKRDQLIETMDEEIIELENQLKSVGKFKEKGPPMKGRKVVGDEDEWVDPLQDIQGSLLFHFGMTIRLTLVTVFYRIPKFLINLPKKFLE